MSAKDKFHEQVKRALIKDRWTVTDDPSEVTSEGRTFIVDLGGGTLDPSRSRGGEDCDRGQEFSQFFSDYRFYGALGQFSTYRLALEREDPDRVLYLAVPENAYETFFRSPFMRIAIEEFQLLLIVYEPKKEIVVQWIK